MLQTASDAPGDDAPDPAAVTAEPSLQGHHAALAALALGGFAIGTTEFVAMGLLPQIADGVHVSIPDGGYVISAYALGVVVGAPLLAGFGARFSRRSFLIWLMVAYAAANLLSAAAPSFGLLLLGRFAAGFPHGAYFGVAALAAANMAPDGVRARAVARAMLGLSLANVIGVPIAAWVGQNAGWRAAFALGGTLAALAVVAIWRFVPWTPRDQLATFRRELGALRRPQVLLALATGAIGGGGLFAIYSYISPILTGRAGLPLALVPVALAVAGMGMVVGGLAGGRLVDWQPVRAIFIELLLLAGIYALFASTSQNPITAIITMFFIGMSFAVPAGLQLRLMDVAEDAQTLAAAMNHSAFNLANALGAWLGGLVLAAGLGLTAPMWVASGLALAGTGIFAVAVWLQRRTA